MNQKFEYFEKRAIIGAFMHSCKKVVKEYFFS